MAMLKPRVEAEEPRSGSILIDSMSLSDLLDLREKIDRLLPATALRDLDLEKELVVQFMSLKELQADVLSDDAVPANQRSQVANSVGATLQNLTKMQETMYSHERFKQIETMLIGMLNSWPEDMTKEFFVQYEALKV